MKGKIATRFVYAVLWGRLALAAVLLVGGVVAMVEPPRKPGLYAVFYNIPTRWFEHQGGPVPPELLGGWMSTSLFMAFWPAATLVSILSGKLRAARVFSWIDLLFQIHPISLLLELPVVLLLFKSTVVYDVMTNGASQCEDGS